MVWTFIEETKDLWWPHIIYDACTNGSIHLLKQYLAEHYPELFVTFNRIGYRVLEEAKRHLEKSDCECKMCSS